MEQDSKDCMGGGDDMKQIQPPQWAINFLLWFCREDLAEAVLGDLEEIYWRTYQRHGKRLADSLFVWHIILFFQPFALKKRTSHLIYTAMFQHNVKIAYRHFISHPFYFLVNIIGLIIGLSCSLILILIIRDEMQMDQFHEYGDHIYRAYFYGFDESGEISYTQGASPYPLYTTLKELDGVEDAVFMDDDFEITLEHEGEIYKEEACWATPTMFNVFSVTLIEGDISTTEENPQSIFVSESAAEKWVGKNWPGNTVGKTVKIDEEFDVLIAGVYEDIGTNSSFRPNILLNAHALPLLRGEDWAGNWGNKGMIVYAQLVEGVNPKDVEAQLDAIYKDKPGYGVGGEAIMLFPFEKNYLWTRFEKNIAIGGRIEYLRIFLGAAIFLLIISCINFINLATAQASSRAKEVGVRKTVGASKGSLFSQFLTETGMLVIISLGVSLLATAYLLPNINELTEKSIIVPISEPSFLLMLLGLGIGLTLLAGLYPSFILTLYQPVKVLKNNLRLRFGYQRIRKGLVVFQFVLSAFLIISTFIFQRQIQFIKYQNLGLNRNNVIHFSFPDPYIEKYAVIKEKLEADPKVSRVISSTSLPTNIGWIVTDYEWEGRDPENGGYFYMLLTDFGFDKMFEIDMKEGRFFDERIGSDSSGIVINEKALDFIQMDDPVGKTIYSNEGELLTILGVMKNFPFKPIRHEIEPLMIRINSGSSYNVLVKSQPEATAETIELLQKTWEEVIPNYPLEYFFLDESYEQMYRAETLLGLLAWYLSGIAILISCLGLFGLATFTAAKKTKEIGIRKVLGATVMSIVGLLSKDFVKLIIIGLFIAIPLSWVAMNFWLENYAYRVNIEWWIFLVAGVLLVAIGCLTVSFLSLRAAWANPIDSLRDE